MSCLESTFFSEHHLEPLNRNCTPSITCEVGVTEEGLGERETQAGGQQESWVSCYSHPQVFINKHFLANLSSKGRGSFFGRWLRKVVSHHFQAKTVEQHGLLLLSLASVPPGVPILKDTIKIS